MIFLPRDLSKHSRECEFFYDVYFLLADEGIVGRAIKKFRGSIDRTLDEKGR